MTKANEPGASAVSAGRAARVGERSHPLAAFRSAAGNHAFGRFFIQTKLKVSEPGDTYEIEADRVADEVMRMPDPSAPSKARVTPVSSSPQIHRACAQCSNESGSGEETSHDELDEDRRDQLQLWAKRDNDPPSTQRDVDSQIAALQGSGETLGEHERAFFEPRFGVDLGGVHVHTGSNAATAARSVNALAFTTGPNIVFGAGQYRPDSEAGRQLLAHELTHVVQQGSASALPTPATSAVASSGAGTSIKRTAAPVLQRRTRADEEEFAGVLDDEEAPPQQRVTRTTTPNPTATPPPTPTPLPPPASFAPLTGAALTDRTAHGLSTDAGPMVGEIESVLFPTGGSNPPCVAIPAGFNSSLATALGTSLTTDIPTLTPADAPDPMALATTVAGEAMPIITSHYAPHAPSRSPAAFMAIVSRKPTTFGDPIRANASDFAEFLEWYAGARAAPRGLTQDKCGIDRAFWMSFVSWLAGAGSSFDTTHHIRERAALFDTFRTTVTIARTRIQFGRGFARSSIPHTVVHEAMHLFQHPDLDTQIRFMPSVRSSTDIIIEGFAEYLARGVRDAVVTAIQALSPRPLTTAEETAARAAGAYNHYFAKTVELRDILYRHGQDGEEAIRRAFFLGEGWRFGLLETATGGSPIETDRAIPGPVDALFGTSGSTISNPALLDPIVAYVKTRGIATIRVTGRTDPRGTTVDNDTLGQSRADAVKTHLVAAGIDASRISASSRGSLDQIPGGNAVNRRATVEVIDARNEFPGLPAVGRP
jgi:outer membrane protein OmpA-like peptidoglycan-associated protein